jgi:cellulose biosynthesis protein BcsQ
VKKIAFFNNKGGVGKTTITINVASAIASAGRKVLLVDADPQCNLTAFYIEESRLDNLLDTSDGPSGQTLWSSVKPVVEGRGGAVAIPSIAVATSINLLPGDVMLSEYEEALPEAWTECFARKIRGYDVTMALSHVVDAAALAMGADVCFYDIGPNVGALNRAILLDCDYFLTPVAADLFSLRALSTVGRSVRKWVESWQTIRSLASPPNQARLFSGQPAYLGYIASAFKIHVGRSAAGPHADWERLIAPRVRDRVVRELAALSPSLAPFAGTNKLGGIKNFHSLAAEAQQFGVPIGGLRGMVNSGHNQQVNEAGAQFAQIAKEVMRRAGI